MAYPIKLGYPKLLVSNKWCIEPRFVAVGFRKILSIDITKRI